MNDRSNDPNWRKYMDQKWQDLQNDQKQRQSQYDLINSDPLFAIDPRADARRLKEHKEDIKKLDKRSEANKKHTKSYIQSTTSHEKGSIGQLSARRKALHAKIKLTPEEHVEYVKVNKDLDKEVLDRQKKWDEEMKDL